MADPFDETEERYRQEQFGKFAKKWWPAGAALALALVGGVIGYDLYSSRSAQRAEASAAALSDARKLLEQGQPEAAAAAFSEAAKDAPGGYKALAHMQRAGALLAQSDRTGAQAALEDAQNVTRNAVLRDATLLQTAMIAADQETLAQTEARVKPLLEEGGAWSYQARELIAMEAMAEGNQARAREEFRFLSLALEAPQGVRQRAQAALSYIGSDAPDAPPAANQSGAPAPAQVGEPQSSAGDRS